MTSFQPYREDIFDGKLFSFVSIFESGGCLTIKIQAPSGEMISVIFDSFLSYRRIDEGDALKTLSDIKYSCGLGRSIYLVKDSDFIDWFIVQCDGVRDVSCLKHFLIMTVDDLIDVISLDDPFFV